MRIIGWIHYFLLIQCALSVSWLNKVKKEGSRFVEKVNKEIDRAAIRHLEGRVEQVPESPSTLPPPPPPTTTPAPPPPSTFVVPPSTPAPTEPPSTLPPPPPPTTTPSPPPLSTSVVPPSTSAPTEPPLTSTLLTTTSITTTVLPLSSTMTEGEINQEKNTFAMDNYLIIIGSLSIALVLLVFTIRKIRRPSVPRCEPPSVPQRERVYADYERIEPVASQNTDYQEYLAVEHS